MKIERGKVLPAKAGSAHADEIWLATDTQGNVSSDVTWFEGYDRGTDVVLSIETAEEHNRNNMAIATLLAHLSRSNVIGLLNNEARAKIKELRRYIDVRCAP